MNTLIAPQRSAVPDTLRLLSLQGRTPRTSLPDRLALRLALTLLLWGTRPLPARREDAALRHRALLDLEQRERDAERRRHLLPFS